MPKRATDEESILARAGRHAFRTINHPGSTQRQKEEAKNYVRLCKEKVKACPRNS